MAKVLPVPEPEKQQTPTYRTVGLNYKRRVNLENYGGDDFKFEGVELEQWAAIDLPEGGTKEQAQAELNSARSMLKDEVQDDFSNLIAQLRKFKRDPKFPLRAVELAAKATFEAYIPPESLEQVLLQFVENVKQADTNLRGK